MDMSIRSPRSDKGSCSHKVYSCRKGVAVMLCLLLLFSVLTLVPKAVDYSYTEYTLRSEHLAAYFTSGKLSVTIASYTANSGSIVTNVVMTDYFIDNNGFIWFYNPALSSDDDLVHKENNQFLCNVYIDLGFNFYLPPQEFAAGTISSYPNTSQAFIDNSKVNLVRGAVARYTVNSDRIIKTYHYEEVLNNFSYFNTFYNRHNGSLPYNYKMRLRSVFSFDDYYGDQADYFDTLDINWNVTCNNSNVYYIPMFCMYGLTVDILDDPGAPTQGTNHIVQQLDHIADLVESGNATNVQICDAVTAINNSISTPTTQQLAIESSIESMVNQEIADVSTYSGLVDDAESVLDVVISDVSTAAWSTDEVMPQNNNWINTFFDHRIFNIIFSTVAICAMGAFILYKYF